MLSCCRYDLYEDTATEKNANSLVVQTQAHLSKGEYVLDLNITTQVKPAEEIPKHSWSQLISLCHW